MRTRTDLEEDHEPHLAHESPRGQLVSWTIAALLGVAIVAATMALFS